MKKIMFKEKEYKTKNSILKDTVSILPWIPFVEKGIINDKEWANSHQTIINRFNLNITEEKIDGRKKESKKLPYFTWRLLINN